MIKYLLVAINSIALFFYSIFFENGPVTVKGNFPASMKPGTEVTAELIVNKGSLGGFAKLQVEVPEGMSVKESDNKGATFSFASGIGKWIWTGVPSDAEFTIKFVLVADAAASGAKSIGAKFSYIENNNKQVVEMPAVEVMVGDGSAVAKTEAPTETKTETPAVTETPKTPEPAKTETPTETKTTETAKTETKAPETTKTPEPVSAEEPNSLVSAKRTITKGANAGEWNVNVKIKKDGIKGFARYSDNLPEGFSAKSDKTNGSSFSVADNRIKFVWVNVPETEELEISYVLSGTLKTDVMMEGEFSYLESNQSKFYKLPFEKLPVFEETTTPVTTETKTETPVVTTETKTETPVITETKTETPVLATETKTETPSSTTTPTETAKTNSNISYCVQIGAYTNMNVTSSKLAAMYKISESIRSEMAGGFTKFMIGKHGEYKQARDHRETARGKGVNGAFVAAYNGPTRITVQEALMISNQKWYK
ncbi:MAG: hypothetical protein JNK50_09190 [Bacteroidia bacterium]|nr:hypothetical protein [Bacteroidia bacterium]